MGSYDHLLPPTIRPTDGTYCTYPCFCSKSTRTSTVQYDLSDAWAGGGMDLGIMFIGRCIRVTSTLLVLVLVLVRERRAIITPSISISKH